MDNTYTCKVVTSTDLKHLGIKRSDLIEISKLGLYGFNAEIIEGMNRYEIWPDTYNLKGKFYVVKNAIFGATETLLLNAVRLYETVDQFEKVSEEIEQHIAENPLPVEAEVVEGELIESPEAQG